MATRVPSTAGFGTRDGSRLTGFTYMSSWVTADLRHCYQVMECDDVGLLEQWMAQWQRHC